MQAEKWRARACVAQDLLDAPQSFEFVQAVALLERMLPGRFTLRFNNSCSMAFPASQLSGLQIRAKLDLRTSTMLRLARERGEDFEVRIQPSFMGLLGVAGALPYVYSEDLSAQREQGSLAFLDMFSNRMLDMFAQTRRKYRMAALAQSGRLGDMLAALGGARKDAARYYAGIVRTRPLSAHAIGGALSEHFGAPIVLEQFVGAWVPLEQKPYGTLGVDAVLGEREWRNDLSVNLRLGPLDEAQLERFLPRSPGAAALEDALKLFAPACLSFTVELILAEQCCTAAVLGSEQPRRLGWDAFLSGKATDTSIHYTLFAERS